jgi:hypothetical protein
MLKNVFFDFDVKKLMNYVIKIGKIVLAESDNECLKIFNDIEGIYIVINKILNNNKHEDNE